MSQWRPCKRRVWIEYCGEVTPQLTMKAFLLTAGLGTRLRTLTDEMPKCLLPICGKPLLEIWLDLLAKHGIGEVLINTHWRREKVVNFLEGEKVKKR